MGFPQGSDGQVPAVLGAEGAELCQSLSILGPHSMNCQWVPHSDDQKLPSQLLGGWDLPQ